MLRTLMLVSFGSTLAYVAKRVVDERRHEARMAHPVQSWPDVSTAPTTASGPSAPVAPDGAGAPGDVPVLPHETAGVSGASAPPVDGDMWVKPVDGACPDGYEVKVKLRSSLYHLPGMSAYGRTRPDRCYVSAEAAEADGFTRSSR